MHNDPVRGFDSRRLHNHFHYFACALTGGGVVRCWGRNSDGQLGTDAPAAYEIAPPGAPVAGLGPASAITSGSGHACAMLEGGRISCWGDSGCGAVGDGAEIVQLSDFRRERQLNDRLHAVAVVGLPEPATAVVAGPGHTCAILARRIWIEIEDLSPGESGTGEQLLAEEIARILGRGGPRIGEINVAAVPEDRIEAELFGWENGAFTGSSGAHPGITRLQGQPAR